MNVIFENNTPGFNAGAWQLIDVVDGNTFENINFIQNKAPVMEEQYIPL